jgi:protein TIF31
MIPTFINNLTANSSSIPLDSKDLADSLHKFGINIRYVGKIYAQLHPRHHAHYIKLIERFVIIRSFRKFLRDIAIDESKQTYIDCMVQNINMLLGNDLVRNMSDEKIESLDRPKVAKKSKKKNKKRKFSSNDKEQPEISEFKRINSAQLLEKINQIAEKRYAFPKDAFNTYDSMTCLVQKADKLAFLRDLCISLGVVIKHKNYIFSPSEKHLEYPLKSKDIVDFKVKTKSAHFKMDGLKYNYKNAEAEFNNRNFDGAYNMFRACQQLILSAYGLLNADFIYVTNKLATIMVMKGDIDMGVKTQLFVIKLCEKFYGIDNTNTALNILTLSNFLYEKKEINKSINLHTKALKIFDLIGSDLNPNSLLCLHELQLMTEESKNYVTSAVVTQELLDRNSRLFGETDERLLFILAKLAGLKSELGDFKDSSILQARHMFILKQLLRLNEKSLNQKYKEMLTKKLEESEKLKTYYVQRSKNEDRKEKTGLAPK